MNILLVKIPSNEHEDNIQQIEKPLWCQTEKFGCCIGFIRNSSFALVSLIGRPSSQNSRYGSKLLMAKDSFVKKHKWLILTRNISAVHRWDYRNTASLTLFIKRFFISLLGFNKKDSDLWTFSSFYCEITAYGLLCTVLFARSFLIRLDIGWKNHIS